MKNGKGTMEKRGSRTEGWNEMKRRCGTAKRRGKRETK